MFESLKEEPSILDLPRKVVRGLFLCLWAPFVVCLLAVFVLPQIALAILRWPFWANARRVARRERRIELGQEGRLISADAFDEHVRRNEGLAIRDFEGTLWWTQDPPERVREIDRALRQKNERRFIRLYELQGSADKRARDEEESYLMGLSYASLVDFPKGRIDRKDWKKLEGMSGIAMLSFQFKN
jgi:hypothetical protein